jgi:putative methyltransferase (TIGR04325 family)
MNSLIRSLLPPILTKIIKGFRNSKYGYHGSYDNWNSAMQNSMGYSQSNILEKVKIASLKVKNKEVAYERDGVVFDKIQYSWPVLAGLMYAGQQKQINVIDFGGSLGSSYFQNKKFLNNATWNIVEQKHYVDVGRCFFETDEALSFQYNVKDCIKSNKTNVLLMSGVLQYLEHPFKTLDSILKNNFEYVVIDRTICNLINKNKEPRRGDKNKKKKGGELKVQIVSPEFYDASYPCWIFNDSILRDFFISKGFELIEEFDSNPGYTEYFYKGYIFKNIKL